MTRYEEKEDHHFRVVQEIIAPIWARATPYPGAIERARKQAEIKIATDAIDYGMPHSVEDYVPEAVKQSGPIVEEAKRWLNEDCDGDFNVGALVGRCHRIHFEREDDAVLFKIKFGGKLK